MSAGGNSSSGRSGRKGQRKPNWEDRVEALDRLTVEWGKKALRSGKDVTAAAATWWNNVDATEAARYVEHLLSRTFNEGIPSAYDRSMDAVYNATHVGGGELHRLLDGGHTLWGAWAHCQAALPADSLWQEVGGYFTALGHDLSSSVGLPVVNMTQEGYSRLADWLAGLGLDHSWTADLLHVNALELIGACTGALAVLLQWNATDIRRYSQLVASLGLASLVAANPLGVVVTLVGLARSYQLAKKGAAGEAAADGLLQGVLKSGLFIGTAAIIGGPAWVGLVTAVVVYLIAHRQLEQISVADLRRVVETAVAAVRRQFNRTLQPGST